MPDHQITEPTLAPELEAIATAAADRLRVQVDDDQSTIEELQQRVGEAARVAIGAGLSLGAIADAEQVGQARARRDLATDVLRRLERAARRKREAEREYDQAVIRAVRLGLPQRDVAAAADVAHGTIRAIVARAEAAAREPALPTDTDATNGAEG